MIQLLYLDRYHLDDPLFIRGLARAMALQGAQAPPRILLHGSGAQAEQLLEGEGSPVRRAGGVLQVNAAHERALVERGIREANRIVVATLTDALIAAIPLHGTDRGLLRRDGEGYRMRHGSWVRSILAQRVLPVVSALTAVEGVGWEVAPAEALLAFARGLEEEVEVVFFAKEYRSGVWVGGERVDAIRAPDLPGPEVHDEVEVVRAVAEAGVPTRITSPLGLTGKNGVEWTSVLPSTG